MKSLISLFLIFTLTACAITDDFLVKGKTVQKISVVDIKSVVVRCFCSSNIDISKEKTDEIKLTISGEHGSYGYHGKQKKPRTLPQSMLEFAQRIEGDTLFLESKEYTFIHHQYIIQSLSIAIPKDIDLKIEPVAGKDLEGRKI